MEKKNYIVAVDIGSSEVVVAVGTINENNSLEILALATEQTEGVTAGLVDNNEFVAEALRKAKGRLFPCGWWHIIKALFIKQPKRLDFLLAAVKPEYQSKGVFAMIFNQMLDNFIKMGIVDVESNPELEDNKDMQNIWNDFEKEQHKRRRAFKKELKS